MKIEELAKEIIRYGKCTYDIEKEYNIRIQYFFYDNQNYKIVRQNGEFIMVKIIP